MVRFEIYFECWAIGPADGLTRVGDDGDSSHGLGKICPQIFWYCLLQKVEPNSPPFRLWAKFHNLLLLNRIWQKWWCVTSEIRTQKALGLPSCFLSPGSLTLVRGQLPCHVDTQQVSGEVSIVRGWGSVNSQHWLARRGGEKKIREVGGEGSDEWGTLRKALCKIVTVTLEPPAFPLEASLTVYPKPQTLYQNLCSSPLFTHSLLDDGLKCLPCQGHLLSLKIYTSEK